MERPMGGVVRVSVDDASVLLGLLHHFATDPPEPTAPDVRALLLRRIEWLEGLLSSRHEHPPGERPDTP